jgi:hypothetical protein
VVSAVPPVNLKIIDRQRKVWHEELGAPDEYTLPLPAGVYYAYIQGTGDSDSLPYRRRTRWPAP